MPRPHGPLLQEEVVWPQRACGEEPAGRHREACAALFPAAHEVWTAGPEPTCVHSAMTGWNRLTGLATHAASS